MGTVIHARNTPEGIRYKLWSTSSDTYVTEVLTIEELNKVLMMEAEFRAQRILDEAAFENSLRIARANDRGTSEMLRFSHDRPTEINDPWDTERCQHCGGFHHDFRPQPGQDADTCEHCGEAATESWHTLPCPREKKSA